MTEEVSGLDLVALALRLADGVPLAFWGGQRRAGRGRATCERGAPGRGFAVQARLNAETMTPDGTWSRPPAA